MIMTYSSMTTISTSSILRSLSLFLAPVEMLELRNVAETTTSTVKQPNTLSHWGWMGNRESGIRVGYGLLPVYVVEFDHISSSSMFLETVGSNHVGWNLSKTSQFKRINMDMMKGLY